MSGSSSAFVFPPMNTMASSQQQYPQQPKSPKSPKVLENPLLKSSMFAPSAPSLVPEREQAPPKEPSSLTSRPPLKDIQATPGPPPNKSLSLNTKLSLSGKFLSFDTPTPKSNGNALPPISSPSPSFFSHWEEPSKKTFFPTKSIDSLWVVAYGFQTESQLRTLRSILEDCGQIVSQKSNSNWIAVQYSNELSVAHASARQMVPIESCLCGIARCEGKLLQELMAQPASSQPLGSSRLLPSNRETQSNEEGAGHLVPVRPNASLNEEDILMGYKGNSAATKSNPKRSACEKLVYWYFDWDTNEKLHQD